MIECKRKGEGYILYGQHGLIDVINAYAGENTGSYEPLEVFLLGEIMSGPTDTPGCISHFIIFKSFTYPGIHNS